METWEQTAILEGNKGPLARSALPVTTKQITSLYRFRKNIKSVMIDGFIGFPL